MKPNYMIYCACENDVMQTKRSRVVSLAGHVVFVVLRKKGSKMQVSNPNNVKIYNLSAGKSLPDVSLNIDSAIHNNNTHQTELSFAV